MKNIFSFICCGNVDDGKSTLIGRLLLNSDSIKKDEIEEVKKYQLKNHTDKMDLSLFLDGLLSERKNRITIDVAHRYFNYKDIRYHILDCPGHEQYINNMAIAAATADTALIAIDCIKGIQPQTLRHIDICNLFCIKNLCICLTKCDIIMDKFGQVDKKKINELKKQIKSVLKKYDFSYTIIPVSAIENYNISKIFTILNKYAKNKSENPSSDIIFHIQANKKPYCYGRMVYNNKFKINSQYMLYPEGKKITIKNYITPGCIQIKENIDIEAGDCIANTKVIISDKIKHHTFWFDKPAKNMLLKHGCRVSEILKIDENNLELDKKIIFNNIDEIKENGFGIIIDEKSKNTIGCSIFRGN